MQPLAVIAVVVRANVIGPGGCRAICGRMGAPVFGRTGRGRPSLGVRLDGFAARGRGAGDHRCGGVFRAAA